MADEPPPALPEDTKAYQAAMLAVASKVERALSVSGERRVNNVWEYTQSIIAVCVVVTTCGGVLYFSNTEKRMPPEWWTIAGLVIGFYFGRIRPVPSPRPSSERTRSGDEHK